MYHNRISSSRLPSVSHEEASCSNVMPSRLMETEEMLLNNASGSRSSGSFVRNCAAEMKSMSFNSSWYRWRIPGYENSITNDFIEKAVLAEWEVALRTEDRGFESRSHDHVLKTVTENIMRKYVSVVASGDGLATN